MACAVFFCPPTLSNYKVIQKKHTLKKVDKLISTGQACWRSFHSLIRPIKNKTQEDYTNDRPKTIKKDT